jgi:hypothetical protein
MAVLLLRNEADCLVPNMETELVSSHLPPELNRSPITARAVSSTGGDSAVLRREAEGPLRVGSESSLMQKAAVRLRDAVTVSNPPPHC